MRNEDAEIRRDDAPCFTPRNDTLPGIVFRLVLLKIRRIFSGQSAVLSDNRAAALSCMSDVCQLACSRAGPASSSSFCNVYLRIEDMRH